MRALLLGVREEHSLRQPLLHTGLLQLAALTRLRSLVLWNCMRVTMDGLEVLQHLQGLSDLSLRGCSQLPDALCYPVAHLHALTRLDLRNCERFTGVCLHFMQPSAICDAHVFFG